MTGPSADDAVRVELWEQTSNDQPYQLCFCRSRDGSTRIEIKQWELGGGTPRTRAVFYLDAGQKSTIQAALGDQKDA